ncbi:MAG: radical SAM protein [Spirochaetia bacterium]|nr:radical SAM protein [Spirochaetia bacterium]
MKLPWQHKPRPGKGYDLSWVPGFWESIRPYLIARLEDEVLILPPNLVYKTNKTGLALLDALDKGLKLERLPGMDDARLKDVERFFLDIKALCEGREVPTEKVAYDFNFSRLPILGEIALTYRCNNACQFCYAGCGSSPGCGTTDSSIAVSGSADGASEKEMTTQEVERIIDLFALKAKIPFFSFTGGEPLLRQDLEHLIDYAGKKRLRVNLISNGTLISPERAKALRRAGLTTAQVSLESPDQKIHDTLCGARGAFTRTLAGIKALQEAGIRVQTNSTLTTRNRESLLAMPAFLSSIGVERFSMNLYIPAARIEKAAELLVPYSEAGAFVDSIRKAAARAGRIFYWYSPTPLCIYNPIARGLGNKSCAAADGLIHVNPSGDVLPCSSYAESLGNLLSQAFEDVWFSARAEHFKQKRYAPEACRGCSSFVACQAACPLYWDYAGYGELERSGWAGGKSGAKVAVADSAVNSSERERKGAESPCEV